MTDVAGDRAGGVHLPFRSDVEGLRGLAVFLVVAFHVGIHGFSGGFVGVDVFFVISGYLITALLCREIERTGTISVPGFFARRIRRLIPAAAVVLVATLLLSAIVSPPLQMIQAAVSARAAAAYMSNVHFTRLASDYFLGDVRSNPILHTWSLSVEEQFYLAWPWILLLFARPWSTAGGVARRRLGWALIVIGALSFAACWWYTTANRSLAFYGTPLRAWEFACGGLASLVVPRPAHAPRRSWIAALGWIGFVLVSSAATLYSPATEFPGVSALLPVIGTSLLLIAGALHPAVVSGKGSVGQLLSASPVQWVGRRSYSWYLWHWPILVLGLAVVPSAGVAMRTGFALTALLMAALTYRFVETPTRAGKTRPDRAWYTIRLGLATTVIVVGAAEVVRRAAVVASHNPSQRAFTAAAADIGVLYRDGCVNETGDDRVRMCAYGVPSSPTTVVLFGDSHAVQWFPALEAIARERNWTLLVVAKSRCATADVPVYLPETLTRFAGCERWRADAMDSIRQRRATLVVLSNALRYIRGPRFAPDLPAVTADAWGAGMVRTLDRFRAAGMAAVLIQHTPLLVANVPICLARSGWLSRVGDSCATDRLQAINADVIRAERRAVAAVAGDAVIDLTDDLCDPTSCPATVGGLVAYSDGEHLTATMARALAPRLGAALDRTGLVVARKAR